MSEFEVFSSTRSKYGSSIALSDFQLDRSWFKFHLQWYWTDFFEITNIERISKKCSNFKCIWTTRSQYGSSIAWSNFQLDRNWFKFPLQRYWTDFFEMTNIEIISKKCSNSKSQFEPQRFELELQYYLINLQWDDSYSDICDDIPEFEVFSSTRSKYGSSIALSDFQLDRSWFKFHLQWYWTDFFEMTNIEIISKKCSNFKCIWTTRSQYGSSIA